MSEVSYRQASAKQRKAMRDSALNRLDLMTGIGKLMGNQAFLDWIKYEVVSRDSKGAVIRATGPAKSVTFNVAFKSCRLFPGSAPLMFLTSEVLMSQVIYEVLGMSHGNVVDCIWEYELEDLAMTDDKLSKFLRLSLASTVSCYLFDGGIVARLRRADTYGYSVEYTKLGTNNGCSVTSLDSFLSSIEAGDYDGS